MLQQNKYNPTDIGGKNTRKNSSKKRITIVAEVPLKANQVWGPEKKPIQETANQYQMEVNRHAMEK